MTKKAMYAFSGDPITYGHIDIIARASEAFDQVTIGIGANPDKKYMFNLEERTDMAKRALTKFTNVEVNSFPGLLVDYAYEQGIEIIVKGVRNAADFDYENVLHQVGESQKLGIDTHILFARPELAHISSSVVKAIQKEQGLIHEYVPLYVKQCLEARMSGQYILGVTGEVGCGKSYVCKKFEELGKQTGIPVHNIELDHIGHQILGILQEPRYQEVRDNIAKTFGESVKCKDGTIDRKLLGEVVFNSYEKLAKLNEIMATPLAIRLRREISGKKGLILFNAALIAESDMAYLCNNNTLLLHVDKATQNKRLSERNLTPEQIVKRLASQYNFVEKKSKLSQATIRDTSGKLWIADNSNDADLQAESLFNSIITDLDKYGEMRFRGLWNRINADATPDAEYARLVSTYLESHRKYHSLSHIVSGINEHAEAKHLMENPDRVLFAWFYHDSVMAIKSKVDEERSSQLAQGVCKNAVLSDEFALNVKNLILDAKHNQTPSTNDGKFIVDIDLSIFGKSPEEFEEYGRNIRKEYSHVPEDQFRAGRSAILQKFLARKQIYFTEHFRDKYESQARANLERSIRALS